MRKTIGQWFLSLWLTLEADELKGFSGWIVVGNGKVYRWR